MCGICGIFALSGFADPEVARLRVRGMLQSLSHRGPDAAGLAGSEFAVLGATRLAIRGLEDGRQPMVDTGSGVVAVCNGDIDNHHELRRWLATRGRPVQAATDVAVIPGLFLELGEDFVSKLAGAFALALWDPRRQRLLLARDRAGERPLFYSSQRGEVVFATELGALVSPDRLGVNPSGSALRKYLQFGIFPAPDTPFAEVCKVAPGEWLEFGAGTTRTKTYWRWPITKTAKQAPSLEVFDRTFREAVRRQSDVDVDFGVFLSGGVDSSLVSAVARSLNPKRPLKAYTLRFEEESFDEFQFAETVARELNLDLVTVWLRAEEVPAELTSLVRLVGEPLADPAWLPTAALARRAARDIRLALVGEGADELFGGYPAYIGAGLAERYIRLPAWVKSVVRRAVDRVPPSDKKVTASYLLKRFVQGVELKGLARHRFWVSNISPDLLQRLGLDPVEFEAGNADGGHLLDQVQQWDLQTSLAEGLLTKADRASMSSALELRAPFLDEAVLEFAKSLPLSERVQGFNTKVFLKRYASRYLPKAIVYRRKRGLSVPLSQWFRGPLHRWALARFETGNLERAGIRTDVVLELLAEHCRRAADHARALWTLVVLSEWLDWAADETRAPALEEAQAPEPVDSLAVEPMEPAVSAGCGTRTVAPVS